MVKPLKLTGVADDAFGPRIIVIECNMIVIAKLESIKGNETLEN
jgi:hypothetical protein